MRSYRATGRALRCLALSAMLAGGLSACATVRATTRPASSCSSLVPASWREGVEAPALPTVDSVGEWVAFGDAAVGRLDVANDRTVSALGIVEACERRDAEAVERITRPWWRLW